MASGHPPFRASTSLAVLKRVAEDTPRPIREVVPEVPQWLCDLIAKLHAKDPAQRFQSAREVAEVFGRHLAHLQHPNLVPPPQAMRSGQSQRRRQMAVFGGAIAVLAVFGLVLTNPHWRSPGPASDTPSSADAGTPAVQAERAATAALSTHTLQERSAVRAALIDFSEPDRRFGAEPYDNPLRRAEQCNALLVRFNLTKLGLAPKARVAEATVSFYVWDPSSSGTTKVCAFPLTTTWEQQAVTWRHPSADKSWRDGAGFSFGSDTGPAGAAVVVKPEQGSDTAEPPIEYQLDVTELVRAWLDGVTPNFGLAIAPVIDATVDEGLLTRFQVCGSQYSREQFTPKLTVQARQ
jgi:hypothetical protein